jgi:hypothetical protein
MNEALELYDEMLSLSITPKNRTISPLLCIFSQLKHTEVCLKLFFTDILQVFQLTPTEKDYISMFELSLSTHDISLFHRVYTLFIEDIYTPNEQSVGILLKIFQELLSNYTIEYSIPNQVGEVRLTCGLHTLQSIDITPIQLEFMLTEIEKFALTMKESRVVCTSTKSQQEWATFKLFLQNRREMSTTDMVIVDGANVGYFENNYEGAPSHVDYEKINWMIVEVQ